MELGKVVGQVVSTVRDAGLPNMSLLLVEIIDSQGNSTGTSQIATDPIGAGEGEWVLLVRGSSARNSVGHDSPVDLSIVGIVDIVSSSSKTVYRKG